MRWYYKAMLMRPASALWDCHPHSVNVNTANLSLNVDMKGRIRWRRWRQIIINNRQSLVCWSSFLNNTTLVHTWLLFSTSFTSISTTICSSVFDCYLTHCKYRWFQKVITLISAEPDSMTTWGLTIQVLLFFLSLSSSKVVPLKRG